MRQRRLPCELCGREVAIRSTIREGEYEGKKTCQSCKLKHTNTPVKKSRALKPISDKTREKKRQRSERRSVYFEYHIPRCRVSEESGIPIPNPTRANICHILPKSIFPSLEDDVNNCIYLTIGEHTKFDNHLLRGEFDRIKEEMPNTWRVVLRKLPGLLDKCTERGRMYQNLSKLLG